MTEGCPVFGRWQVSSFHPVLTPIRPARGLGHSLVTADAIATAPTGGPPILSSEMNSPTVRRSTEDDPPKQRHSRGGSGRGSRRELVSRTHHSLCQDGGAHRLRPRRGGVA